MAPQRILSSVIFTAIDIETTGLTPVVDRIVEIGAVRFRGGEIFDTFEAFVDPGVPISSGASAVNGITDDMVRGRPAIEEVLPRFIDFVGQGIPVPTMPLLMWGFFPMTSQG